MRVIDLRSDTVTRPTPAMRRAMSRARVGDDVFGEDPTVRRLEELAAARLGKEAALLVPSGCMANLIAVRLHTGRHSSALAGDLSHIWLSEAGAYAFVGGVAVRPLATDRLGRLLPADVERAAQFDIHHGRVGLLALENTHNFCGGTCLSAGETGAIARRARRSRLRLHLDGARIFNAATALGTTAAALADPFDSVMFCLSKGLCAPVGSLLCGEKDFIAEARATRKLLGGGMRQAGVLAACGIVSITEMTERLAEDHANAQRLANRLGGLPGIAIDMETVQTNMVMVGYRGPGGRGAEWLRAALAEHGVLALVLPTAEPKLRLVTHNDVKRRDCDRAAEIVRRVVGA